MSGEESESNNKGKNGDNLNLKKEDFSKEFKYSIAVGFTSFVIILGIANFVSTRYLSFNQKFGLHLLIFILLTASIGFLSNILMEGLSLVKPLERVDIRAKYIASISFHWGLYSSFLAIIIYIPIFVFEILFLSQSNFSLRIKSVIIFLFALSLSLIVLSKLSDVSIISFLRNLSTKKIINTAKFFWSLDTIILISIIIFSFLGTVYICQNSYTISIDTDKKFRDILGQEICVPIIEVKGFASINEQQQQILWILSNKWEQKELYELEKGVYYTYLTLSDLNEGPHLVHFQIRSIIKVFSKTEILIVDETEE